MASEFVFKIGDNDISSYSIAIDKENPAHSSASYLLNSAFVRNLGISLPIVSLDESTDKSIVFKSVEKGENGPAGKEGFLIKTVKGQMHILCAYDNALPGAITEFITDFIDPCIDRSFDADCTVIKKDVSVVYYKDWKIIKGDGVSDDFHAIRQLHDYANKGGQKVVSEDGKKYYLRITAGESIIIKTDVDFGKSTFIIDDSFIDISGECNTERNARIFRVKNDYELEIFDKDSELVKRINENGGIKTTSSSLPLNLGYDAMIIPYNEDQKMYHRWGGGKTGPGVTQHEVMLIHADNSIDENTPVLFDFEKLTSVNVYRADTKPITLSGGLFITLAARYPKPKWPPFYYTFRTMLITRPNTTVTGLEHRVDEGEDKVFYQGFIHIEYANNVLISDCKLSGRGGTGTYDISINDSNDIRFLRCTQYNMFDENGRVYNEKVYWGIMGSNYSKNLSYDDCVLSRFDAHAGVYNFSIRNCEIAQINVTGGGLGVVENCKIYNFRIFTLREDYGSFWRGRLSVKNVEMVWDEPIFNVTLGNIHDAFHGFETVLPELYVENVSFKNYSGETVIPEKFSPFSAHVDRTLTETGKGEYNRINPSKSVVAKQPEHLKFTHINSRCDYPFSFCERIEYLPFEKQ